MKRNNYYVVLVMILLGPTIYAQNLKEIVQSHFKNKVVAAAKTSQAVLSEEDVSEFKITDVVPSLNPNLKHVYVQQYHNDIKIEYGTFKLTLKDDKEITYEVNQFVSGLKSKMNSARKTVTISASDAIMEVARKHNLATPKMNSTARKGSGLMSFSETGISREPITAEQVYFYDDNKLKLSWKVSLYEKDGQNWWSTIVDANTKKILEEHNMVIKCNFGGGHSHDHGSSVFANETMGPLRESSAAAVGGGSYNVYAPPVESPNHGNRTIATDPANAVASPYGWHDTNGAAGAEFTITRGNNVRAQDDSNGNNGTGFSPDGGADLNFDFPINLNQQPSQYRSAAITNLFYWNNIMHDIWYQYGFDEASGNFQENNYGKGGLGSDSVNADAQDGSSSNNANFATPPDGQNPRMQMFLFTNPTRDGDLDNVIIAHEYGHGISIRLVGGPSTNVLGGSEQMGEGWSDWFGLMLTIKPGDVGTTPRGVGTFAIGEPTTGKGIRPTAYSTDTAVNDTDYNDVSNLVAPHGVGYGFATILWDMTWELIALEGFDEDFYNGTGGNNIAMALVIEGLKNTANNPGYVSGRDAILQADKDLYNEKYKCLIWGVFSARGVGLGANENNNGGSNGKTDQTVSFVNGCTDPGPDPEPETCSGSVAAFPYSESFEGSLGLWSDATGDDLNWTINSGGTPSSGTGPSSAIDGTSYLYVEASGDGDGFPGKRAILNAPCLDLSSLSSATFSFQYHMIGSAIGTLAVEARTNNDGNWVSIFSRTGAQGSGWNIANIDLADYVGESSVQLRFNTVTGDSWEGDVAIDAVSLQESTGNPNPNPVGCTGGVFNFPYGQGFEGSSFPGWENSDANDVDWRLNSNGTPSNTTGPNSAAEGTTYVYVEASTNGTGFPTKRAVLNTPCFDLSELSDATFSFQYHMLGSAMGSLTLEASDDNGASWDVIFTRSGSQGSAWITETINMASYVGGSVQFRFNAVTGTSWQSDIAIDDVRMISGTSVNSFVEKELLAQGGFVVNIFPNPVGSAKKINVIIQNSTDAMNSYEVINIIGQVVSKGILETSSIDVHDLQSGVYMLKIQNDQNSVIKQFVIK